MLRFTALIIGCFALVASVSAQEVVISDFPLGVGGSVDQKIFEPYLPQIKAIADSLNSSPIARAIVTGGADGQRYRSSHDAKNPSLALGRAHILRSLLMEQFGVDSTQILLRTEEAKEIGPQYRFVSLRLEPELGKEEADINNRLDLLMARMDTLEARPPVEKHFTEVKEVPMMEEAEESDLGISFGAGFSSSPFGGMPIVTAAFTYKRVVYVEGLVGHTWWGPDFAWFDDEGEPLILSTRRRQIGGHAIIYPFEDLPLGFVGGWLRVEEVAQDPYEYTKLSEGLVLGVRGTPVPHLSVTAAYNPSRHRIVTEPSSTSETDQFLLYLTAHVGIGGAR
ncbi:MAG: hypothetical protein JSV52_05860 [Candidatus Zixiibacteriota bacterium]|nr:MAG: hypothetical protein JSV52_05860 [candidate division Zixibacteria bacterium]